MILPYLSKTVKLLVAPEQAHDFQDCGILEDPLAFDLKKKIGKSTMPDATARHGKDT
jgi:hypothetical protein